MIHVFCAVIEPWNSGKSVKFTKAHKIPQNSVEILSNTCLYNIFETYLGKFILKLGPWNMQAMSWNYLVVNYVVKSRSLAMMWKTLALVCFWRVLLLKEQVMTSVRKTLKMLVWSAQNRSISSEFSLKITTKSVVFYWLLFSEVCPKKSREIGQFFREFVPKNPVKFDFFSATYQKPWHNPSDLKISWIEVDVNLEVNWLCLCNLAHFLWWKQSKIIWIIVKFLDFQSTKQGLSLIDSWSRGLD